MASIGFIGLGAMGLPMAKRLCATGHAVRAAVHVNPAPARELEKLGGSILPGLVDVVSGVDVVVSILPGDEQLKAVYLDPSVVERLSPKTLILEMTTATPAVMKEIAAHLETEGAMVLDAPVSGGVKGAADGTLTIICGGAKDVYEKALPILSCLGTKIPLVGGMGAGKALKAVNQLLVGINTIAVAEALALAREMDIDLEAMRDVVSSSSGNSTAFGSKFPLMVAGDFSPRFTSRLMRKDIDIALSEGRNIALPLSSLARNLYKLMPAEADSLDFSSIAGLYSVERHEKSHADPMC